MSHMALEEQKKILNLTFIDTNRVGFGYDPQNVPIQMCKIRLVVKSFADEMKINCSETYLKTYLHTESKVAVNHKNVLREIESASNKVVWLSSTKKQSMDMDILVDIQEELRMAELRQDRISVTLVSGVSGYGTRILKELAKYKMVVFKAVIFAGDAGGVIPNLPFIQAAADLNDAFASNVWERLDRQRVGASRYKVRHKSAYDWKGHYERVRIKKGARIIKSHKYPTVPQMNLAGVRGEGRYDGGVNHLRRGDDHLKSFKGGGRNEGGSDSKMDNEDYDASSSAQSDDPRSRKYDRYLPNEEDLANQNDENVEEELGVISKKQCMRIYNDYKWYKERMEYLEQEEDALKKKVKKMEMDLAKKTSMVETGERKERQWAKDKKELEQKLRYRDVVIKHKHDTILRLAPTFYDTDTSSSSCSYDSDTYLK